MFRIDVPSAAVAPPTPAALGTEGYFQSGNPSTGTPATILDQDWFNALQENLIGILTAAGVAHSKTDYTRLTTAIQALIAQAGAHGQCRLTLSGGNLLLSPFNGNGIAIAGKLQKIPSAGVSLAPAGLTLGLNFIYAYMNAGVMTLEASTTGHVTDTTTGNVGVEIKSGDNSRTLVGMAYVVAGPAFADTDGQRYVLSWFNRRQKRSRTTFSSSPTTSSTTFVELSTSIRNSFITWGADDVGFFVNGSGELGVSGGTGTGVGFDGTTAEAEQTYLTSSSGSFGEPIAIAGRKTGLSEGQHYATLLGLVSTGTGTWNSAGGGAGVPCSLITVVNG